MSEGTDKKSEKSEGLAGTEDRNSRPTESSELVEPNSQAIEGKGKPRKAKDIESLEDFIAYAYERNGQKLSLTPGMQKKISARSELHPACREELLELAQSDLRLAVVPQLLLSILRVEGYPLIRNEIRGFVQEVLLAYPLTGEAQLERAIRNLPDAPPIERIAETIKNLSHSELKKALGSDDISAAKTSEAKRNVLNAILLWALVTRSQSISGLIQRAYQAVWRATAAGVKDDEEKVRRILGVKDVAALGLIGQHFQSEVDAAARVNARIERTNKKQSEQLVALKAQINDLDTKLSDSNAELKKVRSDVRILERRSETDRMHQQDSYEQLRGRMLGRLRKETDLLEEGLHALRQPKPRITVMEDHAERVLERLRDEIRSMEMEPDE